MKQNGRALEFADAFLRSDEEIVVEAVRQVGSAFDFVICPLGGRRRHTFKKAVLCSLLSVH